MTPQPAYGWIVVVVQIVGNLENWQITYSSDLHYHPNRDAAIRDGIRELDHDDFLVGHVVGGVLTELAWQHDPPKERSELVDCAEQLSLEVAQ